MERSEGGLRERGKGRERERERNGEGGECVREREIEWK